MAEINKELESRKDILDISAANSLSSTEVASNLKEILVE